MRLLLDACVLFPTVMREMLIGCASAGLYEPRWSDRILEEWARATIKLGPEAEPVARGEIALLRAQFPSATVAAANEAGLWLPDENDIHVLAAAISGSCDGIVTVNAKDFPRNLLTEEGLFRSDPDTLLCRFHDEAPEAVHAVADAVLSEAIRLSGEDWTMRGLLKKARLPRLGKRLTMA